MKLPNGYGSVYKLSGKRRNPWAARITVGWKQVPEKQKAYPDYKFIGYYKTKKEALQALADFNQNPYDLNLNKLTFGEIYNQWSKRYYLNASRSTIKSYESSYKILEPLHDKIFKDLKLHDLQKVFDESGKSKGVLANCKIVLSHMWNYAIKQEIITPDKKDIIHYLEFTNAAATKKNKRLPFTHDEIDELWSRVDNHEDNMIPLMLIYSGVRISELLELKKENVFIKDRYFKIVKSKTAAGIREVPIADKVLPFFKYWMSKDSDYLIPNSKGGPFHPNTYRTYHWQHSVSHLKSHVIHTPHEARHTCVSLLAEAEIDPRIIKQIVGHNGAGVTEQVYTHISIAAKLEAINKI